MAEGGGDAQAGQQGEAVLKKVDAWWTVLAIDPLSVALVRVVNPISVITPTLLTMTAHLLGLVSAGLFALGALLPAAILFEVRFVIDCADGKLARVRGSSSAAGAYLDFMGDVFVVGAHTIGLALHLYWEGDLPVLAAIGLPASFFAHIATGKARYNEALLAGVGDRPPRERLPGGYRRWMAERRLRPAPSRIDVEHALFFLAPLATVVLDEPDVIAVAAWVAAAYFAYRAVRIAAGGYRIAQERDLDVAAR